MFPRRARDYQLNALHQTDGVRHCAFFLDMRMGKCLICIRRKKRWGIKRPKLIIGPYSTFDSWQDELKNEFEHPALELTGTRKQRLKKLDTYLEWIGGWLMINKEGFRSLPEIADIDWEMIIADESRFLANPQTDQSKFYVQNFRNVEHRVIVTGTPDFKNNLDYFQQLKFMNPTLLRYKNYYDFRNKAFHQFGYDFILTKSAKKELVNVLAENAVVLRRDDINIGRRKEYVKRVIRLPQKFKKVYKTLEDEYILEYRDTTKKTIYAIGAHIWMMQLCGGYIDNELKWKGKINEVLDLLEHELVGEQVVIMCRFTNEIKALVRHINKAKNIQHTSVPVHGKLSHKERRLNIHNFKIGKISIMVAQAKIIAHGVDLKNASTIIYYSQPAGEELRKQSEDRIITLSDEKTVLIIDILVRYSVDMDTRLSFLNNESERECFERTVKRRQDENKV